MPINNPEVFPNYARLRSMVGGAEPMAWGRIATFSGIGILVILILVWWFGRDDKGKTKMRVSMKTKSN
jgi:hypothetical protein